MWRLAPKSRTACYVLVRLFRNCGPINKPEYLFHKIGPQAGQPRGYAFLTLTKRDDAIKARREFDGETLLGRTLLLKPARSVSHVRINKILRFHIRSISYIKILILKCFLFSGFF